MMFAFKHTQMRFCAGECTYLSWAERDHTNVFAEWALLNLVDKLGQLRVSATAVVNLKTCKEMFYLSLPKCLP